MIKSDKYISDLSDFNNLIDEDFDNLNIENLTFENFKSLKIKVIKGSLFLTKCSFKNFEGIPLVKESIIIDSCNFENFKGLKKEFSDDRLIRISGSFFKSFDGIPNNENIVVSDCAINDLNGMPKNMNSIVIEKSNIVKLEGIPAKINEFELDGCTDLEELNFKNSEIKELFLREVMVKNQKIILPKKIERLKVFNTNIKEGLDNLEADEVFFKGILTEKIENLKINKRLDIGSYYVEEISFKNKSLEYLDLNAVNLQKIKGLKKVKSFYIKNAEELKEMDIEEVDFLNIQFEEDEMEEIKFNPYLLLKLKNIPEINFDLNGAWFNLGDEFEEMIKYAKSLDGGENLIKFATKIKKVIELKKLNLNKKTIEKLLKNNLKIVDKIFFK